MEMQLRQRIIGAVVVAALAIILIPLLFKSAAPSSTTNQPTTIKIAAEIPPEPAKPTSPQTIVMAQDKDLNAASSDLPVSNSAAPTTTITPTAEPAQPAKVTMVSTEPVTQSNKKATKHDAKQTSKHSTAKMAKETNNTKTPTTNSHHTNTKVASNSTTTKHSADKKTKAAPATTMTGVAWVVQLGSFANATNAKQLETELRTKGFKAYTQNIKTSLGTLVRVAIGPEAKREKADAVKERLAKEMQIRSVVVPYNPASENT